MIPHMYVHQTMFEMQLQLNVIVSLPPGPLAKSIFITQLPLFFRIINSIFLYIFLFIFYTLGESLQPWAGVCFGPHRLFLRIEKGKILNFLHEVEKMILVTSVQD